MISKTLFGLIDQGSSGVLLITDDRYLARAISSGIMDSEIVPIFKWDQRRWISEMGEQDMTSIIANWDDWIFIGKYQYERFEKVDTKSYNLFKHKKNLTQIRLPVVELLIESSRYYDGLYNIGFSDDGYESIQDILKDPHLIKSYAKAIDATMMVANQELTMTYESNLNIKARVYVSFHHYLSKINKINTKEEADILMTELINGFAYGHNFE
jgi:hypothetical protein